MGRLSAQCDDATMQVYVGGGVYGLIRDRAAIVIPSRTQHGSVNEDHGTNHLYKHCGDEARLHQSCRCSIMLLCRDAGTCNPSLRG
jgi:hypothetical protein